MGVIAVIDVETTGLNPFRNDRIIELATVIVRLDGTIEQEFVTLLNPERDLGPTYLHGLSSRDILAAPRFGETAARLIDVLDRCVAFAGHNVRFDHSFLTAEFDRLGYPLPACPTICTMQLAGGGSLAGLCSDYMIPFDGDPHTALHDARATAQLLKVLLSDAPRLASAISGWPPIAWPIVPRHSVLPLTRDDSRNRQTEAPSYLQKLLRRMEPDIPLDDDHSAILAYTALLDRALEDRHIDEVEGQALIEVATHWAIRAEQLQRANWDYLQRLGAAALADGVVTDAERRDLREVARLLGIDSRKFEQILDLALRKMSEVRPPCATRSRLLPGENFTGQQVCFSGESQCHFEGKLITRDVAAELAERRGMIVAESLTKKIDLLVVADPLTQSGKAKKARQYGIRIMQEHVFWSTLGLEAT